MAIHSCLRSLQAGGYKIDVDDWHKHVHHMLPYERYLKKDEKLIRLLQQIQLPVYVFTNGDRKHAEICLRLMGITDCFKVQQHSRRCFSACTCTLEGPQQTSCNASECKPLLWMLKGFWCTTGRDLL